MFTSKEQISDRSAENDYNLHKYFKLIILCWLLVHMLHQWSSCKNMILTSEWKKSFQYFKADDESEV